MDKVMTEIQVSGLERQAAVLDRLADAREQRTPRMSRWSVHSYYESLDRIERFRREARELRMQAARMRELLAQRNKRLMPAEAYLEGQMTDSPRAHPTKSGPGAFDTSEERV